MSTPPTGPRPTRSHRRRQSPVLSIVLVVVGMVVLFAAGFGLSVIIRGASSGGDAGPTASPTGSPSPEPEPCVTVTVTPGAGLPSPSQVTANVYNATERAGLAASTAETLQSRGFLISTIANDPLAKSVSGVAELRHGPSGASAAELLTFYFPGAIMVDDGRTDATVDVALGASFTDVPPQSEVDAALTSPSPSPSGPGCSPTAPAPVDDTEAETTDATTEPSPATS